jgi:hypothetical protein
MSLYCISWSINFIEIQYGDRGSIVVKAQCYELEGRGFETWWSELFLSIYLILPGTLGPGVYSVSN